VVTPGAHPTNFFSRQINPNKDAWNNLIDAFDEMKAEAA